MPSIRVCRLTVLALALLLTVFAGCQSVPTPPVPEAVEGPVAVRVLTLNILKGGTELGMPLSQTVEVIRAASADIVVLQEQEGAAKPLARTLGFDVHVISSSVAVLSRYPIVAYHAHGVSVAYQPERRAHVFGIHLEAYPYGPYDLRDDPALTAEALVRTAEETRRHQMVPVLTEVKPFVEAGEPVFLAGDFNEPSHLDWTAGAAAAGLHFKRVVPWPTSRQVFAAGLTDSYRTVHGNPALRPGDTWTPLPASYEVHDRIDRVYHGGARVMVVTAAVVGEHPNHADIVVTPYPTDHRGVVVEYMLPNTAEKGVEHAPQ